MMPNVLHPAVAESGSEWTQQAVEYLVHEGAHTLGLLRPLS